MSEPGDFEEQVAEVYAEVELLRHLAEVTRLVSEPDPLAGTLQRICELADSTLPGCEVGMSLAGPARQLEAGAASTPRADRLDAAQRETGEGPCLDALATQETFEADFAGLMERWPRFGPVAVGAGVRAVTALPFLLDGQSRGALNVYAFEDGALNDRVTRLARLLADQATTALANAQLYARSAELARNLTVAMESRAVIEQAKGIVMWHRSCSEDEAFEALRQTSQNSHVKVRDLARELVDQVRAPDPAGAAAAAGDGGLPPHIAGLLTPEGRVS